MCELKILVEYSLNGLPTVTHKSYELWKYSRMFLYTFTLKDFKFVCFEFMTFEESLPSDIIDIKYQTSKHIIWRNYKTECPQNNAL